MYPIYDTTKDKLFDEAVSKLEDFGVSEYPPCSECRHYKPDEPRTVWNPVSKKMEKRPARTGNCNTYDITVNHDDRSDVGRCFEYRDEI